MKHEFTWSVPPDHPAFAGHFPGLPIVPGVVLLDQTIVFAGTCSTTAAGTLWQISQAKFLGPAGPLDCLSFVLTVRDTGRLDFEIRAGERDIARGTLIPCPP